MNPPPLDEEKLYLGLDFGTESVRALLVNAAGKISGIGSSKYRHGVIDAQLPGSNVAIPPLHAFQHPGDWMESASLAIREALRSASLPASHIAAIGSDFTSCTVLPTDASGTPLCLLPAHSRQPHAWPKLWKHHGASNQADTMTRIARQRGESFLDRYGGQIGLEWLFPKILETIENDPETHRRTSIWIEAGDWFVWQLVGGPPSRIPRSTCQAGYKALWCPQRGFPSFDYFHAIHPELASTVATKLPGRFLPPASLAGYLQPTTAATLGLPPGIPVSTSIIDAHAAVPGTGSLDPHTLVMVLGTSSCHMLNATRFAAIPGIAGIVENGILPGYFGYEAGQAAVGDAFDWLRRLCGETSFSDLSKAAASLPPGASGVRAVDWLHGCRTPLMNAHLTASFSGLRLHHGPHHLFRALVEATAFGLRWIIDLFEDQRIPVHHLVATGGLPHHDPSIIQIYSDILGRPIRVPSSSQAPALGSAILAALAASTFDHPSAAISAMTSAQTSRTVSPRPLPSVYQPIYDEYRRMTRLSSSRLA